MPPLFTHMISSYMRSSGCISHRFELRYEVLISFLDHLYEEESLINCAGVMERLETCLSPSSAFNLFHLFLLIMEH
jgi:hypothetical protein